MPKPGSQSCASCQYFGLEATPQEHTGWCIRFPPDTGGNAGMTAWPTVNVDWWCGEWKQVTSS